MATLSNMCLADKHAGVLDRISQLEVEIEQHEKKLKLYQTERSGLLTSVKTLRNERDELSEKCRAGLAEGAVLKQAHAELEKQLDAAQLNVHKGKQQVESLLSEMRGLRLHVEAKEAAILEAERRLVDQEHADRMAGEKHALVSKRVEVVENRLVQMRNKIDHLEILKEQAEACASEKDALQLELRELDEKLAEKAEPAHSPHRWRILARTDPDLWTEILTVISLKKKLIRMRGSMYKCGEGSYSKEGAACGNMGCLQEQVDRVGKTDLTVSKWY